MNSPANDKSRQDDLWDILEAAEALIERYDLTGDAADRDEAIRLLESYLPALATPAGAGMPASEVHARLGLLLAMRYGESLGGQGEPRLTDGQQAIAELRLAMAGEADSDDQDICWALGNLLADRYFDEWPGETGGSSDRDDALRLLAAVARAEEPDADALTMLMRLANDRLYFTSDRADRDALIHWGELLLREPDLSDALAALAHSCTGLALTDRAEYADDPEADRAAAIFHLEAELKLTPADDEDRPGQLVVLTATYWDYLNGDDSKHAAMDRMTELATEARALMPADAEGREMIGLYLATGLYERFRRPGVVLDPGLVVFAMDVLEEAGPAIDEPDLSRMVVVMMMTFKMAHAQLTGSAEAMRAAGPWIMRAIEEIPAGDAKWSSASPNLSLGVTLLASAEYSAEAVDKAVEVLSAELERPGADPLAAARIRGMLGLMLVQRSSVGAGRADLDEGIAHLGASWAVEEQASGERVTLAFNLGSALMARYSQRGDRQDLDAALWYVAAVRQLASEEPSAVDDVADFEVTVRAVTGTARALAGHADRDLASLDAGIAELRSAIALVPEGSMTEVRLRNDLGLALLMRADLDSAGVSELDEMLDLLRAGGDLPKGSLLRPIAVVRMAGVLQAKGNATSDPAPVSTAIGLLTDLIEEAGTEDPERARFTASLGLSYRHRYNLTGDSADIREAVRWLEQARDDLARVPGHPIRGAALIALAQCYRRAGDFASSREAGLAALRERGQDVLLQTGTARGLSYAALAAKESAEVAGWCLADGEPRSAVAALELGRGLVLHAATVVTGMPELLEEAGETELAASWRAFAARSGLDGDGQPWNPAHRDAGSDAVPGLAEAGGRVPDDLRVRVINALARTGSSGLADPPPCAAVAAAVAGTGADALVYLLAPADEGPGYALIVPAEPERRGEPDMLKLPMLARSMSGSLDGYIAAYADLISQAHDSEERWLRALGRLCDWAWLTTMAPLLKRIGEWKLDRIPRLVLVPVGRLSVVPWQAARHASEPPPVRFACAEAVISYAPSGRMLIEVSRRPALDLQASPVMVGDPARKLSFAAGEAEAIAAGCYPAARYLGDVASGLRQADGRGTPAELLAALPAAARPGASVLHLGCHASLVPDAPAASYLELAGGEHLTIETILRQAAGRPAEAPGGLVSLAACVSDYGVAAYDEALSLATAFLAGGAVTVASARWFIDDDLTTLLMFMFHYFMTAKGQSPRDALRLAQLWMADPGRAAPAEMPADLAKDVPDLGDVGVAEWAAFTHQGR